MSIFEVRYVVWSLFEYEKVFSSISSWYSVLVLHIGKYICLQIRHLNVTSLSFFALDVLSCIYIYSQCLKFGFRCISMALATSHRQGVVITTCKTWLPNHRCGFRYTFLLSDALVSLQCRLKRLVLFSLSKFIWPCDQLCWKFLQFEPLSRTDDIVQWLSYSTHRSTMLKPFSLDCFIWFIFMYLYVISSV